MEKVNYSSGSGIFEILEQFKSGSGIGVADGAWVILTSLYSDGTSEKRVLHQTDLTKLEFALSINLVNKVFNVLDSSESTGFITLKDETGLEVQHIFEIIQPVCSLIILGAGHVGRSLSLIASILGFEVILIDDREEFLRDDQISCYGVRKLFLPFDNYTDSVVVTSNCAIVIVTRGHQFDEICLKNAICTNAKYIGMIGSKRRVLAILRNLKKSGLTKKQLAKLERVYAPIGLEIGAKSPQEISVSILAQIIQVMNRGMV